MPRPFRVRGRALGIALVALVALGIALAAAILWLRSALYHGHPGDVDRTVLVHIPPGASLGRSGRILRDAGLLDAPWKLRLAARLQGGDRDIKAGDYRLSPGLSPVELLEKLVAGELDTVSITVPEGWRAEQIVQVMADSLGIEAALLDSLVRMPPPELREELELGEGQSLEGYLFPETYRFVRGVDARTVLSTMCSTLLSSLDDSLRSRMHERGLDLHALLSLASVVEAEATRDSERPRIAAVYLNRLARGWKLEADPTVAYALGKHGSRLSFRDLEVDSAYNTYRHAGLPPGPIDSPGLASIRAVLWPEPGFDAMYFVADGQGGHRFSRTWAEHRRAVQAYRRQRRAQRRR